MSKYLTPRETTVPSQGDYRLYLPKVEIFEATTDFAQLQIDINTFLFALPISVGDDMPVIVDIRYQMTSLGANTMYSVLIHYAVVGPGGLDP